MNELYSNNDWRGYSLSHSWGKKPEQKKREKEYNHEYHSSTDVYEDTILEHHGILGQRWGKRNGPPYPLSSAISTGSKLLIKGGKALKKELDDTRVKRAKQAKDKAAKRTAEKAEKYEKAKQKVIRSGNSELIAKNQRHLSTTEFEEAVKRCELNKRLSQAKIKELTKADKWQVNTQKMVSRLKTGMEAWNTFATLYNTANEEPIFKIDGSYYKKQKKAK